MANEKKRFSIDLEKLQRYAALPLRFILFTVSFGLFAFGLLLLYKVIVKQEFVPNIASPVSRFVADVNFNDREVTLDSSFSKSDSAPLKVTIWRMGDGKVFKSDTDQEIDEKTSITYKFNEAGRYTIGYSIIDENNLSDEAFCTVTFAEEPKENEKNDSNNTDDKNNNVNASVSKYSPNINNQDDVSNTCGKSTTNYNNSATVMELNYQQRQVREGLFVIAIAVVILVYTFVFIRPKKIQE